MSKNYFAVFELHELGIWTFISKINRANSVSIHAKSLTQGGKGIQPTLKPFLMSIGPCGLDLQHFDHKSSKANACLGLIENVSEV